MARKYRIKPQIDGCLHCWLSATVDAFATAHPDDGATTKMINGEVSVNMVVVAEAFVRGAAQALSIVQRGNEKLAIEAAKEAAETLLCAAGAFEVKITEDRPLTTATGVH